MDLSIVIIISALIFVAIWVSIGIFHSLRVNSKAEKIAKEIYDKEISVCTGDVLILTNDDHFSEELLMWVDRGELILENLLEHNGSFSAREKKLQEKYKIDYKFNRIYKVYEELYFLILDRASSIKVFNVSKYKDVNDFDYIQASKKTHFNNSLDELNKISKDLLDISQPLPEKYLRRMGIPDSSTEKYGFLIIEENILDEILTVEDKINEVKTEKEDYLTKIRDKKSIDKGLINKYDSQLEDLILKRLEMLIESFTQILVHTQENLQNHDTELTLEKWHKASSFDT